jgi:hypothetical protein
MRRVVVQDQLDRCTGQVGGIKKLEEFDKLAAAMAVCDQGVDLAGEQIDPGQQAEGAMALVPMIETNSGRTGRSFIRRGRVDT